MGEAKQRRKAQSMLMVDPQMAMERLGTTTTGKPGILKMLSAELISAAVRDGTLWAKVLPPSGICGVAPTRRGN
jgi:hypothetical protein